MGIYSMGDGNGCSLPCGFNSCMEATGLFDGVSREEKRAMRAAEAAERRFRTQKGYDRDTLLYRLKAILRVNT